MWCRAQQRDSNQGLGTASNTTPEAGDNEYDAYRKRMMLAYRFRPNPLVIANIFLNLTCRKSDDVPNCEFFFLTFRTIHVELTIRNNSFCFHLLTQMCAGTYRKCTSDNAYHRLLQKKND